MAIKTYGSLVARGVVKQPDSEIVYGHTGLVEGTVTFKYDATMRSTMLSLRGTPHPDDSNVILHQFRDIKNRAGIRTAVFDCIGISKDPTDKIYSFGPSTSTAAITAHPDFISRIGGKKGNSKNGAIFDDDGQFIRFNEAHQDFAAELGGVESYITGTIIVRATYYTRTPPRISKAYSIVETLPGIPEISGVKNWLYMPPAPEPVSGLWRVSEEFLGSGPDGWSQIIYGS